MRYFVPLAVCLAACAPAARVTSQTHMFNQPDTIAISALARELSSDAMRGRGPWTPENTIVARRLAVELQRLGARPLVGDNLLVPFVVASRPTDTMFNVVGVIPSRDGRVAGDLVGLTAHLDHLGVGTPDVRGDSIYNGFLDDALSIAMIFDVARRYVQQPGERPLAIMFFNLEEQGLLGSKAFVDRPDAPDILKRLRLLVEVDAGSPAGEALDWQIMENAAPQAVHATIDTLAHYRGWTTHTSAPRPISDVFPFSQKGVPIAFPIPGATWRGYTKARRDSAMATFDHYHNPADQWRPDFPWTGTWYFADWLWDIVRTTSLR